MNRSRRRTNRKRGNRKRRSNRRHGGDPASVSWDSVRMNAQPSEAIMKWATTASAPTPCAAELRRENVAYGGRRTRRRSRCKKRRHTRCRHKRRN